MHIFEYSEKSGTKGVLLGKSTSEEIKDRLTRVNTIATKMKKNYENKFVGKILTVLVEEHIDEYSVGFTGNYIKVFINDGKLEINKFITYRNIYENGDN